MDAEALKRVRSKLVLNLFDQDPSCEACNAEMQ